MLRCFDFAQHDTLRGYEGWQTQPLLKIQIRSDLQDRLKTLFYKKLSDNFCFLNL